VRRTSPSAWARKRLGSTLRRYTDLKEIDRLLYVGGRTVKLAQRCS
jgi:hypothetical protein